MFPILSNTHFPIEKEKFESNLERKKKQDETNKSLFSLIISDNGIGIPENIELESVESLVVSLVNTLVDQLDGKNELIRAHGTEFRINFNAMERSQILERPSKES